MGFLSVIATPGGCYWDVRHIGIGTLGIRIGAQVFRGATNPVHLRALSQNLIFLFSRATAGLEGEGPALSPLEAGAQRSWSVHSNTSSVWMSPSESSPTGQPSTARRPAVVALGR